MSNTTRCYINADLVHPRASNNPHYHHMDVIPTQGPLAGRPIVLGLSRNLLYYIQSNIASGKIAPTANVRFFGTHIPSTSGDEKFVVERIELN